MIVRLLGLKASEQLKNIYWFYNNEIDEVHEFIERGYSYFDVYPTWKEFLNMALDEKIPQWRIEYDLEEEEEDDGYEYDDEWEREDRRVQIRALNEQDAKYCAEYHLYGGIYRVKSIKRLK